MTNEQKTAQITRLKKLVDRNDADELLTQLLEDAEQTALAYMHRTSVPDYLITSIGDAALVAYNRLGTEGEASRSEGGESYSFIELPDRFYRLWKSHRLARVGGHAYESEPDTDDVSET